MASARGVQSPMSMMSAPRHIGQSAGTGAAPATPEAAAHRPAGSSAFPAAQARHAAQPDWRRRISNNVASALLVYTALQIILTVGALRGSSPSLLPYGALLVLVVAIIPACRRLEARWSRLDDAGAGDPAHAARFRRDRRGLWLLAIGLPFALTGLCRGLGWALGS